MKTNPCDRCSDHATETVVTKFFGTEHLCKDCATAVRQDGQGKERNTIMTEQEVKSLMQSATSEVDWNNKCDEAKRRCNGYPIFWFPSIVLSGLMERVTASFKDQSNA